ncbi:hypothetical protein I5G59_gp65 [Mycobacterium phage LilMcDreamy]|uniref:Uncharacterized protein n=1 Tax=Mycobacterium phage LilMcDreamy TaxID=2652422 RepID=A0A5P8D6L8_9CAUD|nr:hypothetical protein I5G59_gp65 [Mycobacterium phage LilMcDreamy]QFP94685.1 hypothetical protein SEA_LILMCDREAMY_65 [Mycobacterium phage LilMcDreamy]
MTPSETLDKLIAAWLPKAEAGDPDAAHIVLKAVEHHARLRGL